MLQKSVRKALTKTFFPFTGIQEYTHRGIHIIVSIVFAFSYGDLIVKRVSSTYSVTLADVARVAGVSTMTVSRVVNGDSRVKPETRQRIEQTIEALGYRPNTVARMMRSRQTHTIGFILPDLTNSNNATVAQVAARYLAAQGYRLMLVSTDFSTERELQAIASLQNHIVDGIIVALSNDENEDAHTALASCRVPVLLLDRDVPVPVDSVVCEHEESMKQAVRYLASLGHRHIAFLCSPLTMRPGRLRHAAFRAAMREVGLPLDETQIRCGPQDSSHGYLYCREMLTSAHKPTAMIVGANQMMLGAVECIRELGLSIPGDLSLIGADDKSLSALLTPPMTVIWRDMEKVGYAACDLLLSRLAGRMTKDSPARVVIRSEIILRASTAAPSR